MKDVVARVLPPQLLGNETVYHINPTGSFEIGGPDGDAGVTGRKIIVDTYGGAAPAWRRRLLGQGPDQGRPLGRLCRALSRQEHRRGRPRAAAARSSSLMRSAFPSRCRSTSTRTAPARSATTQIEAAIGRIDKLGGLTPRGIRTHLGLNKPIYRATAAYGHFGRKAEGDFFPWERLDLVDDLKAALAA